MAVIDHVAWMGRVASTRTELISLRKQDPGLAASMEMASSDGATIKAGPYEQYLRPSYTVEGVFEQIPAILKGSGSCIKATETGVFGSYLHEHFNKSIIWKDNRKSPYYALSMEWRKTLAVRTFEKPVLLYVRHPPNNYRKITGIYPPDYSPEARKIHKKIMAEKAEAETKQADAEMGEDKYALESQEHEEAYGYTKEYPGKDHAPIPKNWKRGPFTHANFLKKSYRRCIRVYADEGPLEIARRPKEEESEYLGEWKFVTKCAPGKEAKANVSECKQCPYAVESSFYEREHGIEGLPDELSWSKACYDTFYLLPYINPCQVASNVKRSNFLEQGVKPNLDSWGVNAKGPRPA